MRTVDEIVAAAGRLAPSELRDLRRQIDLGEVLTTAYDKGRYARSLNYGAPPRFTCRRRRETGSCSQFLLDRSRAADEDKLSSDG